MGCASSHLATSPRYRLQFSNPDTYSQRSLNPHVSLFKFVSDLVQVRGCMNKCDTTAKSAFATATIRLRLYVEYKASGFSSCASIYRLTDGKAKVSGRSASLFKSCEKPDGHFIHFFSIMIASSTFSPSTLYIKRRSREKLKARKSFEASSQCLSQIWNKHCYRHGHSLIFRRKTGIWDASDKTPL